MYTKHNWNQEPWQSFNYVVNLPKDYDESKSYPLVFFLHGAGERGTKVEHLDRQGNEVSPESREALAWLNRK